MTKSQLSKLCVEPDAWLAPLSAAMERFEIVGNQREDMFLAACAYESARFARLVENLNYSAEGLMKMWPCTPTRTWGFTHDEAAAYAHRPEDIANRVYANRMGNGPSESGDGWRYRGRGPLQITFHDNYRACEDGIGLPLVDEPELLAHPAGGAKSAAWFWWRNGCNEVADDGDFRGVSGIVNRGSRNKAANDLDGRFQWLRVAQSAR